MYGEACNLLKRTNHLIRFELRPEDRNRDEYDYIQAEAPNYFQTIVNRASEIFETCFSSSEEVDILCVRFRGKRRDRIYKSTYWISCIENLERIKYIKPTLYDNHQWIRKVAVKSKRASIDYKSLFLAIAHQDFGRSPKVDDSLYFLDHEKELVFYMYDDRGLWIASTSDNNFPNFSDDLEKLIIENSNKNAFFMA